MAVDCSVTACVSSSSRTASFCFSNCNAWFGGLFAKPVICSGWTAGGDKRRWQALLILKATMIAKICIRTTPSLRLYMVVNGYHSKLIEPDNNVL